MSHWLAVHLCSFCPLRWWGVTAAAGRPGTSFFPSGFLTTRYHIFSTLGWCLSYRVLCHRRLVWCGGCQSSQLLNRCGWCSCAGHSSVQPSVWYTSYRTKPTALAGRELVRVLHGSHLQTLGFIWECLTWLSFQSARTCILASRFVKRCQQGLVEIYKGGKIWRMAECFECQLMFLHTHFKVTWHRTHLV